MIFDDAKIVSEWINGQLDGEINYKDYSKSYGNLTIESISISLDDSTKLNAENVNLAIKKSSNTPDLTLTGGFTYQGILLDSISNRIPW